LTLNILEKNGAFQFKEALEKMGWDTEKFEEELEIYAKSQTPKMAERIRKEYNRFMSGCGWPLELVAVGECDGIRIRVPKVKPKKKLEIEAKSDVVVVEPQVENIEKAEVAAEQKIENPPETVPETSPVSETEKISETPKEEPKAETAKTDTKTSATAYFTFSDANLFKKLYESMCVLVSEITWKVGKDGISMRQMDPSRVAMIDLTIEKENCTEFNVTTPGLVSFDAETIKKAVFAKPFKKDTSIGVKIDGVIGRITFILKDSGTRERSFATLEANMDDINVPAPKISFNARCKVISKQVAADIKELEKISDHMTIIATAETLKLQANGDCGNGENKYQRGDENLLDLEVKEESRAVFSFSYLKDFIRPTLCEVAMLEFATDMPLKVTLPTKFGDLKFYVAPRIQED